jgi:hypothetical protein
VPLGYELDEVLGRLVECVPWGYEISEVAVESGLFRADQAESAPLAL